MSEARPRLTLWDASGTIGLASRVVTVAQLVRALDCGSRGCGFDSHRSPQDSRAPVAQLDRALASEAKGQRFESSRAHHRRSSVGPLAQLVEQLTLNQRVQGSSP